MAAIVKIVVHGSGALKDLEGVRRSAEAGSASEQRAAREREKIASADAKRSEQELKIKQKAAQAAAKAAEKSAKEKTKVDAKAAKDAERIAQQELRFRLQVLDRTRRERERAEEDATRKAGQEAVKRQRIEERTLAARQKSARDTLRKMGGFLGATAAGGVAAGISAANAARGASGVADAATRVQRALEFRQQLVVSAHQAGIGEQAPQIQKQALSAAREAGQDPLRIMAGLAQAHEEFNALKLFADNISLIAKAATGTGSDVADFIGMMGNMRRAFKLSDDQFMESMNLVAAGAQTGSVSMANFAREFPAAMGIFATNTGLTGIEGVRQFSALAQTVATGGFGAAESATRVERLSAELSDVKVRKGLTSVGIKLPKAGQPLDMGSLIEQISTNKRFQSAAVRQKIFPEQRALQAVEALMNANKAVRSGLAGAVDFKTQMGSTAASGAGDINKTFGALENEGLLAMQRQAIDMQADTIEKLRDYNDQIVAVTKATNELEKAFGTLGFWASSIGIGGAVAGGSMVAGKFLGGGAGTAVSGLLSKGAAGGALATLGTGVGTAGAIAGTVLVGGAVGAAAGMGIDKGIEAATGESASSRLGKVLSEWDPFNLKSLDPGQVAALPPNLQSPEVSVNLGIEVTDKRINIKQKTERQRGVRIVNPAAGPTMAGNGQ